MPSPWVRQVTITYCRLNVNSRSTNQPSSEILSHCCNLRLLYFIITINKATISQCQTVESYNTSYSRLLYIPTMLTDKIQGYYLICNALVPSTLALSYFVMYGVVILFVSSWLSSVSWKITIFRAQTDPTTSITSYDLVGTDFLNPFAKISFSLLKLHNTDNSSFVPYLFGYKPIPAIT